MNIAGAEPSPHIGITGPSPYLDKAGHNDPVHFTRNRKAEPWNACSFLKKQAPAWPRAAAGVASTAAVAAPAC